MPYIKHSNFHRQFYTEQSKDLISMISDLINKTNISTNSQPKALIVPHAGYIYSGPIAATAYATLLPFKNKIKQVVLLGPAHKAYLNGIAATEDDFFEMPLGKIEILHSHNVDVQINENAFDTEHSLEVQLPFLQFMLQEFKLMPFVVGDVDFVQVAELLNKLWGGDETLIVISSDLSHYLEYEDAKKLDHITSDAILNLEPANISSDQACGRIPIQGLLQAAKKHKLYVKILDLRNSGDTAGTKEIAL